MPAPHHSFFTGWMLFLTPNPQCQKQRDLYSESNEVVNQKYEQQKQPFNGTTCRTTRASRYQKVGGRNMLEVFWCHAVNQLQVRNGWKTAKPHGSSGSNWGLEWCRAIPTMIRILSCFSFCSFRASEANGSIDADNPTESRLILVASASTSSIPHLICRIPFLL